MLRWHRLFSVYNNIIKSYDRGLYLIGSHDAIAPSHFLKMFMEVIIKKVQILFLEIFKFVF